MKTLTIVGSNWCVPPTADDLERVFSEIATSRLHRDEPPNRGVTMDEHRAMVIRAAEDKESIKALIPSD